MSATKKKTPPKIDWSLAPRGVVSATAQATMGLVAIGGAGDIAHISPVFAGLGAGVGALSHVVAASVQGKYTPGAIVYRLGCWAGAGAWATWAMWGPNHWWNLNGLAALAVGAVGAGIMAPIGRHTRKTTPAGGGAAGTEVARVIGPVGQAWELRFKRVCRVPVRVLSVAQWANGAGFDLHCLLPPGNVTRAQIAACGDALATDARLPDGCGVEIRPVPGGKGSRGEFVLAVSTVNRLGVADDPEPVKIPCPRDYSPRSILDPIPQGEHRDGSIATVALRERAMLIVAPTGGGKTNQLDDITLGVGRCRDALVWHLDLNGGGMSQFWLNPWLNGETDRPPIDWAAAGPLEALFMTTLAVAIAKSRKSDYREYKARMNAKLLPVSPQLPQIELMVDEGAEVLAPTNRDPITRQVRDNIEELQRIGRNEAVRPIISSLRPTADMIAANIVKQSRIKMALQGIDAADLGLLYGYKRGISIEDLPSPGCAFIGVDNTTPRPMKAWWLEPEQIHEAALAIAGYRPELDAASAAVANAEYAIDLGDGRKPQTLSNLYATRYTRMRAAFTGQHEEEPATTTQAAPARPATTAARPAPLRLLSGGADSAKNWPHPLERQPEPATTTTVISARDWPEPIPGRQIHAATTPAGVLTAPAQPIPELVRRAIAAYDAAGDDRMHSEVLAAALGLTPHELAELLGLLGIKSLQRAFLRGGKERRGYARADFAAVAERITSGELAVPEKVAAWPAA